MNRLINLLFWIFIISIFILSPFFIGLVIVSMSIVPLTWLYAKITGKNYYYVIDQSNMLYKLNKFGQWMLLIGFCYFIGLLIIWM